ncbi:3-oxoadipyl-CoA thiolase (plasmid) [Sinorhizobium meliloti]|uniref:3-oxoadipyl-CoA thiolase n=1 Tax=Rhizobium meliloti TaxID=382 RepID=UPI002D76C8DA|nr:3-oxoadipyl-CoA thiolase [Sinorhizobium meliloti]WRQ71572.1 3-oxoadipyl-CoA thiolase [Sinorhizobium meliloti]
MSNVYLCDYIRTPIGRFGGTLASIRADDLGAVVLKALMARHSSLDWQAVDEVVFGCANQAGEDNRNVARMSLLLAGLPVDVPGTTINRLCGSGMDAIIASARAIKAGEADLIIAGGVESMSRAPFVVPKAESPFSRTASIEDTTIGWRLINPLMKAQYGVDSMPETAENVAEAFGVSRADQDAFAYRSQKKAAAAQANGRFSEEIVPVEIPQRKGPPVLFSQDEHPRPTTLDALAGLKAPFRQGGSVTAGNASGVNDGAAVVVLAGEQAVKQHGLTPIARILGGATAGVAPRIMGIGPVPACRKLMARLKLEHDVFDVIELNEAFASQGLACLRELGVADDDPRVNPNGGAIALGHPLGMSGVRIAGTAALELVKTKGQYAAATMCIGVGQGIAIGMARA